MMLRRRILNTMTMLVIAATLILVGCEKDEDELPEIYGSWLQTSETNYFGTSVADYDSSSVANLDENSTTLIFNPDGTGSIRSIGSGLDTTTEFTYTQTSTKISMAIDFLGMTLNTETDYNRDGDVLTTTTHYAADGTDPETWTVSIYVKQ